MDTYQLTEPCSQNGVHKPPRLLAPHHTLSIIRENNFMPRSLQHLGFMKCCVLGLPQIGKRPGNPSRHSGNAGEASFPTDGLTSSSSTSCISQLQRQAVLESALSWVFPSRAGEHHHLYVFPPSLKVTGTGILVGTSLPNCSGTSSSLVPTGSQSLAQQELWQPWGQVRHREEQMPSLHLVLYSYFKSKNKFDKATAMFP